MRAPSAAALATAILSIAVAIAGHAPVPAVARLMTDANFPSHNLAGGGCAPVVASNHTTPQQCQAACDAATLCDMWTFVPAHTPSHNQGASPWCCLKTCYLTRTAKAGLGHGGCELPNAAVGVVSGAKNPADWLPPSPCNGTYCFGFQPGWASGSPATTLPNANFSVRKMQAIYYPRDGMTYAYVDVVNFTDAYYPDSYSSEIGVFSSADGRAHWTYHGIAVPRGAAGSWDAGGVASPGAAVADDGTVLVGFAAENNPHGGTTRGIGLASAPHPLGPFEKHSTPVASPFGNGVCAGMLCDDVVLQSRPGGEVHIYHSVKGSPVTGTPGIRHRMSTDSGRSWGTSTLVLSTALQPGTNPLETIAGRFFPGVLGGRGGMVLITDGGLVLISLTFNFCWSPSLSLARALSVDSLPVLCFLLAVSCTNYSPALVLTFVGRALTCTRISRRRLVRQRFEASCTALVSALLAVSPSTWSTTQSVLYRPQPKDPDFELRAVLGNMVEFVAAQQVQLERPELPSGGNWANFQLEFVPGRNGSIAGVAYALYTNQTVFSRYRNATCRGYTHTVYGFATQPHWEKPTVP